MATTRTKPSKEVYMQCPKCGFQQTKTEVCEACGIIFAKYEERLASTHEVTPEPASDTPSEPVATPQPGRDSNVKTMIIVVLAIALGLMAGKIYFGKSAKSPDVPQAVTRQQDSVSEPIPQEPNIPFQQPVEMPRMNQPEKNQPLAVNRSSNSSSIAAARNATVFIEDSLGKRFRIFR